MGGARGGWRLAETTPTVLPAETRQVPRVLDSNRDRMIPLEEELEIEAAAQAIAFEEDPAWPKWSSQDHYEDSRGRLAQQIRVALLEFLRTSLIAQEGAKS